MESRSVIEVVEYDEAWPVRAAAARADLISLGVFDAVEHIGSTSVPGLAAKPVVDLMAVGQPGRRGRGAGHAGRAGLPPARGPGMPGRLFYYRDEDGQRVYQLIQELTDRARADRGLHKPDSSPIDTISITIRAGRTQWKAMKPRIQCG